LRFGILLQGSALLNLTKDSIVPMFLGLLAGPAAVGLVGWASTIAAYPILALMPLGRLYFPVFARLQHDRERLGRAMERIITWTNRIAAPITLILLVLARPMTEIVYTPKWLPALELLQMLAFANLLSATSTPCLGLLNGLGLPQKTFRMSVVWLAVTWLVGAPLIWKFGIVGFGIANVCAGAANIYLFAMCKREVPFRILKPIALPWSMAAAAAALSGGLAWWLAPDSLWELLVCGFGGGISYALVMTWLERGSLRKDWELFRSGKTA
jgi:O-antigen/teichoic acid export membrane protein